MMRVTVEVSFSRLQCVQPDESQDDPYLWVYWFKLDGDTVRQAVPGTTGTLVGTVTVATSPGSHGNLGVEDVAVGVRVPIPPAVGTFATTLRPIVLDVINTRVSIPGLLVALVLLMDEDSSPSSGIEAVHQDLRTLIEQEVNDFFANLSLQEVIDDARSRFDADPGTPLEQHARAAVLERFAARIDAIAPLVRQTVEINLMAAHTLGAIWEFLDADELLSARLFAFDQADLLLGPAGLSRVLTTDLVGRDEDGVITSFYHLTGGLTVTVKGAPSDLRPRARVLRDLVVDRGSYEIETAGLCEQPGIVVEWNRKDVFEEQEFVYLESLVPVAWSLDGHELRGDSDSVVLAGKDCTMEFFDPSRPGQPAHRSEVRDVVVAFQRFTDGPLPGMRLRNRPEDGAYYASLQAHGVLGGGARPLLSWAAFSFDGQLVESPFFAEYEKCIDRFRSPGVEYAKSKRVGPKELWGPRQRLTWYEEQIRIGEQMAQAGVLSQRRLDAIRTVLEQRLNLS